jgi:hypothetical protein
MRALIALALAVGWLLLLPLTASASVHADPLAFAYGATLKYIDAAQPTNAIVARITVGPNGGVVIPVRLSLAPSTVKVGTVVIVIRNLDRTGRHQLTVNNATSPSVGPGARTVMRVTFKRAGTYVVQTVITLAENGGAATLKVVE